MAEPTQCNATNTVIFIEHEAYKESFAKLYNHAMALIDETAVYIDGDGKFASRCLADEVAALYATETMHLTTRLMQVASWLLLQRAAADKEMSQAQIGAERAKISLSTASQTHSPSWQKLPPVFQDLIERSRHLEERVRVLDKIINPAKAEQRSGNPVAKQIDAIRAKLTSEALLSTDHT